jgi:uncharacterized protein with von Willebrand factor type A (vWA) domain
MQKVLGDFIHALRQAGLPVSPAETLDAFHASQLVGLKNPNLLKSALGMTLAKTQEDLIKLEQVFDHFFSLNTTSIDHNDKQVLDSDSKDNQNSEQQDPDENQSQEQANNPSDSPNSQLALQLISNDQTAIETAIAAAADQAGATRMQMFTQKGVVSYRIMQALGEESLNAELSALAKDNKHPALIHSIRSKQTKLREQVKEYVEQQYLLYSKNIGKQLVDDNLKKVKLSNVDFSYYQQMSKLVTKAAKQLATQHGRRKKTSKRGTLDVRKTIAANAAFDGFLFHTKWKSTRIERPKVMVICDVSGSVSKMARFLLMFLYSLQDVLPKVRSFVFASNLAEVTKSFDEQDIEEALSIIMKKWAFMPTDYGRALIDFKDLALNDIDNKTTVIMLGDARNNYSDSHAKIWQEVYQKSKRVLWLNPEGQYNWDSGDSIMSEYSPYCSRVEPCSSINDLTRILGSLLKHS